MPSSSASSDHLTECERFHGLLARPFSLTPDLRFAYHSRSHSTALQQVTEALRRREGLIVVTGEIGTGKTMLCRTLLETIETRTFLSVILDPGLTVDDLLHQVLTDFGLITDVEVASIEPVAELSRHQLVTTLQRFLATLIPLDAHAVIMIDEAQHLNPSVLEEIRLLSNFESDDAKLLQVVLVGQPDLNNVLRRPDMRQFDQRITRRYELRPLANGEVQDYIERRLFVASGAALRVQGELASETAHFTPSATRAVAAISRGIPRVVNTLCDRALEIGFERQTRTLDRTIVLAAARDLKLPVPAVERLRAVGTLRAAAASLLLVAGLGGWWWWSSRVHIGAGRSAQVEPVKPATALPGLTANEAARGAPPPSVPTERPTVTAGASSTTRADAARDSGKDRGSYLIAVAAFRTAQRAASVAADIAGKGLPVSTRTDPAGGWHQIVVGPYVSAEEAQAAQRALAREGFPDTRISFTKSEQR